ncbi:MAG: DUF1003 domain-containing protein [Gemmatimonadota bacterium]
MGHFSPDVEHPLSPVLEHNIRTLVERRQREKNKSGIHERAAAKVARFAGSVYFIYAHLVLYGGWILVNAGLLPRMHPFDPNFTALYITATLEAILLTAFVLISQNRMAVLAERQADLDLQISLLSEHEITQLITLMSRVASKLGVSGSADLAELQTNVSPEQVLNRIDEHEERIRSEEEGPA